MQSVVAQAAASLHPTAVGLFLNFCDIPTIARIECSNKTLAAQIHLGIEQNGRTLLSRAVCAAATGGKQHQQALEWLLTTTKHPRHLLNSSADTILTIPFVHLEVAKTLVAAGLQFSWPDIAAAASRPVAGIGVWVAAGAVVDDVPELAGLVCCCKGLSLAEELMGPTEEQFDLMYTGLQQLRPSDLSIVLQLATNKSRCFFTAEHILSAVDKPAQDSSATHLSEQHRQLLKQQITAPLLQQLIATACLRHNTDDITCIAELPAAADIPSRVILDHLQQAVHHQQAYVTGAILAFQQASSIGTGQLLDLLQLAVRNRDDLTVWQLLQGGVVGEYGAPFSACSLLTAEAVCGLVALALQHLPPDSTAHCRLLQLPAAQGIDATAIAQLLQLAIRKIPPEDNSKESLVVWHPIKVLLQLPAAAGLDANTFASLIQLTIQQGGFARAHLLLKQDAAQEMHPQHLVKLLGMLFQLRQRSSNLGHAIEAIRLLPASKQINTADITRLLKGQAGSPVLQLLLGLPASASLDAATVLQLLLHHVSRPETMHEILNIPAAQKLKAEAVQMLLDATLNASQCLPVNSTVSSEACVGLLCALPAAVQLEAERVVASVQMCLQAGRYLNAHILLQRLASGCNGTSSAAAVMDVITTVVLERPSQQGIYYAMPSVDALRQQLPGARDITSSQIADLVSKALQLRHDEHVPGLLRLPAARKLEPVQIQQLLQQAIEAGHVNHPPIKVVTELWKLCAADNILPKALQRLLHLAIQQQATFRDYLDETSGSQYREWEPKTKEKSWQADWNHIVLQLCWLPAAAGYQRSSIRSFLQLHLQPAAVAELLQTAIQLKNPTAVGMLCQLPGAAGIDAALAAELLLAAVVHRLCSSTWRLLQPVAVEAVEVLLQLPGVQQIGLKSTNSILQLAMQHTHRNGNDSEGSQCCCPLFLGVIGLRPGRALSSSDIKQLVAQASAHGNIAAVQVLQNW